ncbi:aminotransferase class V-fold PLP-dependent enzyme [Tamlana fucoidanivorans]|uniref:Aminotransferase class V-fold PLP-dependent enzyme n=1 Tax=Allotamlana fucoidanivorans TaxID=2583814 RepID=A0A5C4SNP9_9FLAO|nr:aminotransferase class V-fold PLP-dependent enzyme [Tamlana fucoidanivorans]TNJ45270.1 aminotransferase class V-fold PLP-dependent enzyme [Tamlana fucoidanivorans]
MGAEQQDVSQETLDPTNWETTRKLMHQMIDDAIDYTSNLRQRHVWEQMPLEKIKQLETPLPQESTNLEQVYHQFKNTILPFPMGNIHPRFWAWYMGSGTVSGFLGDFWASVMNPNLGGGNHAGHKVEEQVINWIKEMMRFPPSSSGLLVSGGSMANFTALTVARNIKLGYDVRQKGITKETANKFVIYGSSEIHSCNQKALEILGLGAESLHKIPVNADYTINLATLEDQITKDKNKGLVPFAIIGTSGTINTGAIDDLKALSNICKRESLWFHVDGAIGAVAVLSDIAKPQLAGIELADSIALDLHKWLHMPFEAGCVLIKNHEAHKNTFSVIPEYLEKHDRGLGSGSDWFSEYGLQLSRRFNALKIWMSLKEHGAKKFGRMITKNINQAHYLGRLIKDHNQLELLAPIGLDIVCFRYHVNYLSEEKLNAINREIKLQIEEQGLAMIGYTSLQSTYCLRVAIANHRTRYEDFDLLVNAILEIGVRISGSLNS